MANEAGYLTAAALKVYVRCPPIADRIADRDHAVMKTITIDCAGVNSADEFWGRYLDATEPDGAEHFGRNLDAFWDAIEGGGPGWPGEVVLAFQHADALSDLRTSAGGSLLNGLRQVAQQATRIRVQFS